MRVFLSLIAFFILLSISAFQTNIMAAERFALTLCEDPQYHCIQVKSGDTWHSLFPDSDQNYLIRRLNRMNTKLRPGITIAVPVDLQDLDDDDVSLIPDQIPAPYQKVLIVYLSKMAWGAYDSEGNLLRWSPISGGKGWCADTGSSCRTRTGEYSIKSKRGAGCRSGKFPIPNGGAPMPYCMFYSGGYAIHGSKTVPGYHASHGCVRTFTEDAQWLSQNFVELPGGGNPGTKVIVYPYD